MVDGERKQGLLLSSFSGKAAKVTYYHNPHPQDISKPSEIECKSVSILSLGHILHSRKFETDSAVTINCCIEITTLIKCMHVDI